MAGNGLGRGAVFPDAAARFIPAGGGTAGGLGARLLLLLYEGGLGEAAGGSHGGGTSAKVSREPAGRLPQKKRRVEWATGETGAVRFAIPEGGGTSFDDAVFGRIEFAHSELEDFVLLRGDGGPTYHLSVVADDIEMRMTHIIRGADHISNTPKQILLYHALGAALPTFAHVPLILGADKTRSSKRHGATSVIAYRDEGIVPEAFRNFLALLGWTPPEGTPEMLGT